MVNEDNDIATISFQSGQMSILFEKFPVLLADVFYKLQQRPHHFLHSQLSTVCDNFNCSTILSAE